LQRQGLLYKDQYSGWYSVPDEAFLSNADVIDSERGKIAKDSGHLVEYMVEETYKFRLKQFKSQLIKWIQEEKR
jgi:methionyl-tRNA synthetase